jgi:signal transduction histidine kinase
LQVFENLFRNAVDHNEPPLTVRVGSLDQHELTAGGSQRTGFFVADDGNGIPAPEQDEILEHGYTTSTDGTGLGLSIVQEIVNAHDWELRVTAGTDGGARFEITGVEIN